MKAVICVVLALVAVSHASGILGLNGGLGLVGGPAAVSINAAPLGLGGIGLGGVGINGLGLGLGGVGINGINGLGLGLGGVGINGLGLGLGGAGINGLGLGLGGVGLAAGHGVPAGASYVSANRGSVHVAPLPGHIVGSKQLNLSPAPGTIW